MRKRNGFLQTGLEIAVILLLGVIIGSMKSRPVNTAVTLPIENVKGPTYVQFEKKPYTSALYENTEELGWSETKILDRPRQLEVPGRPFKGNNSYNQLSEPIVYEKGTIVDSPFDYTQAVELTVVSPDEKDRSFWSYKYEAYYLNQEDSPKVLFNNVVCFSVYLPELYNGASFQFSPANIVLINSDGKTLLPYWTQDDYQAEMLIWTKLPVYTPEVKKILYIAVNKNLDYSVVDETYAFSNFDSVFTPLEPYVTGQYQFRVNKIGTYKEILDISGNHTNAVISNFGWGENNWETAANRYNEYCKLLFRNERDEGKKVVCEILNKNQVALSLQEGSVEMVVDFRNGTLSDYSAHVQNRDILVDYQKLVFMEDTNHLFTIYYFEEALYWRFIKNHTPVLMKMPLSNELLQDQQPVLHIFCTWNQSLNRYCFYLNGIEKTNWEIQEISSQEAKTFIGNLIVGGSVDTKSSAGSFIPFVFLYNKSFNDSQVKDLMTYHWHRQNPKLFAALGSYKETKESRELDIENVPVGNSFFFDLLYAAPIHNSFYRGHYYGTNVNDREVNVLSEENTKWQPVFGIPTHFYSYVGTYIEVKEPCMVEYIQLKITNPEMIKELKISFLYTMHVYMNQKEQAETTFGKLLQSIQYAWNYLVPSAEACGPFYRHRQYGSSLLELVSSDGDMYLYRLKEPIYVDKEADFMQISYKNAARIGLFSLAVKNIYYFSDNHYSKAVYAPDVPMKYSHGCTKEWNEKKKTYTLNINGSDTMLLYPNFQCYLLGEEKGVYYITVQDHGKELALVFKNMGKKPITFNKESLSAIQTDSIQDKWIGFRFVPMTQKGRPQEGFAVEENFSFYFRSLVGKTLKPGETTTLPFFNWRKFQNRDGFKSAKEIAIYKLKEEEEMPYLPVINFAEKKIIQWSEKLHEDDEWSRWGKYFTVNITPNQTIELGN